MSENPSLSYLKLKTAEATKLGRNGGSVTYLILSDAERQELFVSIVGNSGGGCWSTEIVPLSRIEACLPTDRAHPFPAKALMPAFIGKSVNNASFLVAALRAEHLFGPVPEKPNQHLVAPDWREWKERLLGLAGEPYVPPVKASPSAGVVDRLPVETITHREDTQEMPADEGRQGRKRRPAKVAIETDHACATP